MGWTLLSGMMPGSMKMLWVTDFRQYTVIARKKQLSVAEVLASSLTDSSLFVPRLSPQASAELHHLQNIVRQVVLNDERDARHGSFCLAQGKLDLGTLYCLLQSKDAPPHSAAKFI